MYQQKDQAEIMPWGIPINALTTIDHSKASEFTFYVFYVYTQKGINQSSQSDSSVTANGLACQNLKWSEENIKYIKKIRWISPDFLWLLIIHLCNHLTTFIETHTGKIIFALYVIIQLLYWKLAHMYINICTSIYTTGVK